MKINEAIKRLRMDLLLEQKEFGELIGVAKTSISHYESGNRRPRLPIIRKMVELAKKHKVKIALEDFLS